MFGVLIMITMISSYTDHTNYRAAGTGGTKQQKKKKERNVELLMLRLATASLLFMLLFVGFAWMKSSASGDAVALPTAEERVIVVSSGDTLWSIASSLNNENDDVRRIVYNLKERNDLRSSMLQSGQTLIIPNK